jgi:hypothetical protein
MGDCLLMAVILKIKEIAFHCPGTLFVVKVMN